MNDYLIYSKPNCAYCTQAKQLLESKGIPYDEIVVDVGQEHEEGKTYIGLLEFKTQNPFQKTLPMIVKQSEPTGYIGGFTQLKTHFENLDRAAFRAEK